VQSIVGTVTEGGKGHTIRNAGNDGSVETVAQAVRMKADGRVSDVNGALKRGSRITRKASEVVIVKRSVDSGNLIAVQF
jgi:hypothetical protein